jgi:hypothetical protein
MATTLGITRHTARFTAWLALGAAACLAAQTARAGDWMPLLPDQDFYDFQLFAPPDLQEYEMYPEPSEGIFFSYDRLYWSITPPSVTGVGETENGGYLIPSQPISPQAIVQLNNAGLQGAAQVGDAPGTSVIGGLYIFGADPMQLDLNTSWMRTAMTWGNRYEGGWIYDNRGVALSYFSSGDQNQRFTTLNEFAASSPTQIFTQTSTGGGGIGGGGGGGVGNINQSIVTTTITSNSPPPDHLISQKLTQDNMSRIQSAGAAMIVRRELGRRGSGTTARFAFGPRFVQFEDRFNISYESNQYAFNQGPTGGNQGQGLNIGGAGGQAGGAAGGIGGAGGVGGAGGIGGGGMGQVQNGAFGGATGNSNVSLYATSAGDVLGITGVDTLTGQGQGSPLQTGEWETSSFNNMVGPEFAVLFETGRGRWTFSSELKFVAGLNWQNTLYRGSNFPDSIGADYIRSTFNPSVTSTQGGLDPEGQPAPQQLTPPPLFLQIYGVGQSNATNDVEHNFVFTPIGEWRFGAQFKVSQAVTLRAGYTGLVMGSIARASSNTAYKSVDKPVQYAEILNPEEPASIDNPWVVKTSGLRPTNPTPGSIYTDPDSPYFRQNPIYNRIGAAANDVQDVVLTNGVDFGVEIKY